MNNVNFTKIICAWCGIDIEINPSEIGSNGGISHGICKDCLSAAIETLAQQEDSWRGVERGSSSVVARSIRVLSPVGCKPASF